MSDRASAAHIDAPSSKPASGEHPAVKNLHATLESARADSGRALDEWSARLDKAIARARTAQETEGDDHAAQ